MGKIFISLFAAAVIIFPAFMISKQFSMLPQKQEKAKQKAIERGHVVTAYFVKSHMSSRDDPRRAVDQFGQAIYEYEYNGKRYKYTVRTDTPPQSLQLYFLSDPKKASIEGDIALSRFSWPLAYAVVALFIYLIFR